ncbi:MULTISPECIES: M15 family metallopeptidase [Bacteria]|uniref:M15 family metallopeptidase n=1 Tax=Bacteria TaxID=2 RepID=UPI003C7DE32F
MRWLLGIGIALLAVPAAIFGLVILLATGASNMCLPGTGTVGGSGSSGLPSDVSGYKGEQLNNAAVIIDTIAKRGLSTQAQVIAVTAAIGESSLINVDYGDDLNGVTNPDGSLTCSLGLFQQQWCLPGSPWGTREEVMDPVHATNAFVDGLLQVKGWEILPVSLAINRVQGNSDPMHYAKFEEAGKAIVGALTGKEIAGGETTQCKAGGSGNYPPPNGQPPGPWGGHKNGYIPAEALTSIPWQSNLALRGDATAALIAMNAEFRSTFGYDIPINDGYRDYAQQVQDKETYGDGAATPGTSNHGWAMAVDIGDTSHYVINYSHPIYTWLVANAGKYGWVHPPWARPDGTGPHEAWHWEYWGTTPQV